MSWLDDWWWEQRGVGGWRAFITADPGLPAYPWLPDGSPIRVGDDGAEGPMPVSFVAAARNKFHPLMNLDQLHRCVLEGLKTRKWDTRTPAQRRADDWAAYKAAKERWAK